MNEQSFHEKDVLVEASANRLSDARPKFKPVLVKKLLADVSDDDTDDPESNTENSDEEFDDFDGGFQPLPDEGSNDNMDNTILPRTDVGSSAVSPVAVSFNTVEGMEPRASDSNARVTDYEQKSVLNTYLKDSLKISDYVVRKSDVEKIPLEKSTSLQRKSSQGLSLDHASVTVQSQWKPVKTLDKRKSSTIKEQESNVVAKSYSPDVKRHSYHIAVSQASEVKESRESRRYSSTSVGKQQNTINEANEEKAAGPSTIQIDQVNSGKSAPSNLVVNTPSVVLDTPMKQPQGSTRPNPCLSHRNIFQTPQNKMAGDFVKNPIQTPATIFSHWSQHHMAQTPMQNPIPVSRESIQTPGGSIVHSQPTRNETPRFYNGEGSKSGVRRPLADSMFSAPVHSSGLPRVKEVPNESQPSPAISRDNNNPVTQDGMAEKKPVVYSSSSYVTHESKENRNPNTHEILKADNLNGNNQLKLPVDRKSVHVPSELTPKVEPRGTTYQNSAAQQSSRTVENYDAYQVKEIQNAQRPPAASSQPEQQLPIQCSIPQQNKTSWSSRQNKIISVNERQFMVLGVIGQGMSCEVVRAQDLSSGELRAIKCVNLSKMDKDSAQGCLQEICMLDRLKAPCIVHMYSFEIKQPWVHVVLEIGDTDLSRLSKSMLQEKKKIPLTMILYYFTEMLTAVKHIHENGVIHSDLKPANFLLVRGRLKLIDFGIASNINSDMTSVVKNCPIGTLNYISPEALMDINAGSHDSPNHNVKYKISYKSDVWSLGCILYGLVYGVTPFNHIRQQWAKISAITDPKHKINFPLKTGSDSVPLILVDVMNKCLQRDPKARPTVAELLEIPYLQSNIHSPIVPNIPSNIMKKIKHALSDEEWESLIQILDKKS